MRATAIIKDTMLYLVQLPGSTLTLSYRSFLNSLGSNNGNYRDLVQIVMVMELAGHGDLLEYVKLRGAIPEEKSKTFFAQLVSAVDYMHSLKLVHR